MSETIKLGILGYGNLGKGAEAAAAAAEDLDLTAVFTRRSPDTVKTCTCVPVYSTDRILDFQNKIDVLLLCGGSATDLPRQTPEYIKYFNVVDSFDTHAKIPEHFSNVDRAARSSGKVGIISVGWDPGLFSLSRMYAGAVLPEGKDYTFWGKGVSQGHSDAIRRIEGVADARQYTIPVESGGRPQRKQSGIYYQTKTHPGMLCSCQTRRRSEQNRAGNQDHAQLFLRL